MYHFLLNIEQQVDTLVAFWSWGGLCIERNFNYYNNYTIIKSGIY